MTKSSVEVPDGVWSKPWYKAADEAYQQAMLEDSNDRMSALALAVDAALAALPVPAPVEVQEIETVTGDLLLDPGEPFWRIVINDYCADFDTERAARNFADQINRLSAISSLNHQLIRQALNDGILSLTGNTVTFEAGDRGDANILFEYLFSSSSEA